VLRHRVRCCKGQCCFCGVSMVSFSSLKLCDMTRKALTNRGTNRWLFASTTLYGGLMAFRATRAAPAEGHVKEIQHDRPVHMQKQPPQVDPSV
jgi:hypothetical protein